MSNKTPKPTFKRETNAYTSMAIVLKELMAEMQVSERELAERTGIAQQQISRYVQGQKPKQSTIVKLAEGLGVSVERLCPPDGTQVFVCPHCGHRYVIKEAKSK